MSRSGIVVLVLTICYCLLIPQSAVFAQYQGPITDNKSFDPSILVPSKQYVVQTFMQDGKLIDKVIFPGKPPVNYRTPIAQVPATNAPMGIVVLSEVPAFDWSYGCSTTSAAMIMGYYDRHGYPNMYTGPTNSGVCPLNNSSWGQSYYPSGYYSECPLSATHQGIDGRALKGHVDDYWIDYNNSSSDPYITGGWTQHTYADCTGDFMGTNQSALGCPDGATLFYFMPDGSPLCDYNPGSGSQDGCHGMRLFAQSRGYTVVSNCSQYIQGYNGNSNGFTFAQYCAEIDAGRPVMIQVAGHSMVGYGYNTTGNVVYIHDTWDYSEHTMTWGGSYQGLQHQGVTTFQLAAASQAILTDRTLMDVNEGGTATFQVKLSAAPTGTVTVTVARYSGDSDINVQSGSTLTFNSTNWSTYQTVTLAAAQDIDGERGSAVIRCSASGWTSQDVTAYEADDDHVILVDRTSLSINENGTGTFYVKLKGQPSSNHVVSVDRISGDSDIYVQSGASLTFTTSNWDSYQPVTITAYQDADAIDDTAIIRCDSQYTWTPANVNVTATDDDSLTVAQMKMRGDSSTVACGSAVVTAVFGDYFYIEANDRSSGLKVHKVGHGLSTGSKTAIQGTMVTGTDGERFVEASTVTSVGSGSVKPIFLSNRLMGGSNWMYNSATGAGQKGVLNGTNLSNIGLLVRSNGKVKSRSSSGAQIMFWNFDTNPGWTFQGQWAWGRPTGNIGPYSRDPASGYTGTNVVGYNLNGDYANNLTTTYYAATPAVNCSGRQSVHLKFYRWLGVEAVYYDYANIQVSKDGTNWTTIWYNGTTDLIPAGWTYFDYDISSIADNQPTVYVRWGMGPTDYSYTFCGWNIDDVEIAGSGDSSCIIDDGSGVDLKVAIPLGVTIPAVNSYIGVTGISSCEYKNGNYYPVLKVRTAADIN